MASLDEFIDALEGLRQKWHQQRYSFPGFDRMIAERGHVDAARNVVQRTDNTSGIEKLRHDNRLDLTVEALIADGRFDGVLGIEITTAARDRLRQLGYKLPRRIRA